MVVSRKNGARRRDEILDAALDCFVDKGVLATGIEDIRKAAQASPSSIYHQFDGIADIIVALVDRIAATQYSQLAAAVAAASSFEQAVRGLVEALLAWTFAHEKEARFIYQAFAGELGPERKRLEAAKYRHAAALEAALRPWLEGSPFATWSYLQFSVVLLGAAHQACRVYLTGQEIDRAWMTEMLPALAVASLGAATARRPRSARPLQPARQRRSSSRRTASPRRPRR